MYNSLYCFSTKYWQRRHETGEETRDLFWERMAAATGEPEFEVALAKIYLQELDGKELDIEKCLYYAKSAADKGHPEGVQLYAFVSCTQALKEKGILTGEEDGDEMMAKMQQAAMDGDEDALKLFG